MDEMSPGWEKKIDVERLAMGSSRRCPAGQLGLKWEQLSYKVLQVTGRTQGFELNPFASPEAKPFWIKEIKKRLKKDKK